MGVFLTACLTLNRRARENTVPVAVIAAPAIAGPLATVTLDGSGSYDEEEQPLTFEWTQASGDLVVLDDPRADVVSFTAPDRPQSLVFSLTVFDGLHTSVAAQTQVRITTNTAPSAAIATLGAALAGGTLTLDASGSSDPEGQALTYIWTSPSHPALQITAGATPTITVPLEPGATLELHLTVSDGALSATANASVRIEQSDATAVFVDAAAACTNDCDGTRAKPFKQPMPAYGRARTEQKPVLIAPGYYQPLTLDGGVSFLGRCDPMLGWQCGVTDAPSIIAAADGDPYAVVCAGLNDTPMVFRDVHLLGGTGQATPDGSIVGALRCQGCSVVVDRCHLEANGAGQHADSSRVISLESTTREVRIVDSTLIMGRAGQNYGVFSEGATDVELTGLTIRSKADVRNGAPHAGAYLNSLVFLHGGSHAVLDRSRLELDAGPEHRYAWAIDLQENGLTNTRPTIVATSNLIWEKGFAGAWGPSDGAPGVGDRRSNGNVLVHYFAPQSGVFVNNTFLGNATAMQPGCLYNVASPEDEACLGVGVLYGDQTGNATFDFVNNYFASLYRIIWNIDATRYATFVSNSVAPDVKVLSDGATLGPTIDAAVLGDGHLEMGDYGGPSQLGSDNVVVDCLLKDVANGDAHLLAGSPCIDSGAFDRNAPSLDLDGAKRPQGAAIDRGAFEVKP